MFSLVICVIVGYLLYLIGSAVFAGYTGSDRTHVCRNCGSTIAPRQVQPGSTALEILLWLFFLVPGLIYSIWRTSNKRTECPNCHAPNPVPLASPAGRALAG